MSLAQAICAAAGCAVMLLIASAVTTARPLLVWNATPSLPRGLYWVMAPRELRVGDLVLLQPDPASAKLFAERGYLPLGVPLLKRVAALAGATVCRRNGEVTVDGKLLATPLAADGKGRPLRAWDGCRPLAPDELFVLIPEIPESLDGRYFGPSPRTAVIGRALPLWVEHAAASPRPGHPDVRS